MRIRGIIIGIVVLLAASIGTTWYLVNHPLRPKPAGAVEVGSEEPQHVVSPSELFAPSATGAAPPQDSTQLPAPSSPVADGSPRNQEAGATSLFAPPPVASRIAYPEWKSASIQVREARAVSESLGYYLPKWSPVGLDVAFTNQSASAVWIVGALPGGSIRELIAGAGVGKDFRWNLDGMSLRVKAPDSQYDDVLITGERYASPPFNERAVVRDGRIYWYPPPGPPTAKPVLVSGPQDRFSDPLPSPNESRIAYRGAETGIYIGAVDGSQGVWIGEGANPSWLPDSSGIVYDIPVSDGRAVVGGDLWLAMADGSMRTNLTQTPGIVESCPSIAPDGERIAFVASGTIYIGKLVKSGSEPAAPSE